MTAPRTMKERLRINCSEREYMRWKAAATRENLSLSALVREVMNDAAKTSERTAVEDDSP